MNAREMKELGLDEPCACYCVRKANRFLSQYYDACLAPVHLKTTQLTLLRNIVRNENCSVTELGRIMLMDQTTVTRNVALLVKSGYLSIEKRSDDARQKMLQITSRGLEKIKEATPYWRKAQAAVQNSMDKEHYVVVLQAFSQLQEKVR